MMHIKAEKANRTNRQYSELNSKHYLCTFWTQSCS